MIKIRDELVVPLLIGLVGCAYVVAALVLAVLSVIVLVAVSGGLRPAP